MPDNGSIAIGDVLVNRTENAAYLRELAVWYKAFAEKTDNPVIWECRIATAEDLERRAMEIQIRQ